MTHPTSAAPAWLEIAITAPPPAYEALNSFLFELGCRGILLAEPPDGRIKGYWPAPIDISFIQNRLELFVQNLQKIFHEARSIQWTFTELETENWSDNWRKFFKPDKITPELMVVPVWEPIPPDHPERIIKMDPGPAFGTGRHATTRMCLAAMEEKVPLKPHWSLLDVGTGSAILAIYAAQLGAGRILALDNDPQALSWAERNIELNQIADKITLSGQSLAEVTEQFSLVVANLILSTILELAPFFAPRLEPEGCLVLSGLLRNQAAEVEAFMQKRGLVLEKTMHQEEWVCLVFKKTR